MDSGVNGLSLVQNSHLLALPAECQLNILSFLNFQDLAKVSLVCKKLNGTAWVAFWDKVFKYTDNVTNPEKILNKAVKILEPLLSADSKADKSRLIRFFRRCGRLDVTQQVNFIRNIFRTISPVNPEQADPRFDSFLKRIFEHPKCPVACKLKVVDYCKKMNKLALLNQLEWKGGAAAHSAVPSEFSSFQLVIPESKIAQKLHLHSKNSFKPGELVVVMDSGEFSMGKTSLFYGKIAQDQEPNPSHYAVHLAKNANGSESRLCLKEPKEMGKYPENKKLPTFCK